MPRTLSLSSPSLGGKRTASSALSSDDSEWPPPTHFKPEKQSPHRRLRRPANRPTALPPPKLSRPPMYLKDKTKRSAVSSACDRPKTQYTSARNLADSIKITAPTITDDDFRGLNNYLINNNIAFHTYPLDEERKVKAVIRGIPVEFTTSEVSEVKPSCALSSNDHTANYRGCLTAPKFNKPPNKSRSTDRAPPSVDNINFPVLSKKRQGDVAGSVFRLASVPSRNAWGRKQSLGAAPESAKGTARRVLPPPPSNTQAANQSILLGDDIKTIMSVLRVVKSTGFAELVSYFRRARTGEN
ncbi:hypothetical protein EVAR_41716_1 [Eumeta japonica]|uniref:Nucleic-acid-binding protein from transposon X-element n=1 Tax=Eumeta variegata TaxID=151549 RepID=A0A4C1XDC5_EUMVA|nr:hypothetical protein EVAR_41716_1 [Eumeta japonica]